MTIDTGVIERTVHNDGVDLAVFEQGNPDGPTLVLGWPDTHRLWDGVVPGLGALASGCRFGALATGCR